MNDIPAGQANDTGTGKESAVTLLPEGYTGMVARNTGAIESRIAEILSTISSLDDTSPSDMSEFYYMHGFNELDLAVRDLL